MNKITYSLAVAVIVLSPLSVFASNGNTHESKGNREKIENREIEKDDDSERETFKVSGAVTALGVNTFTVKSAKGKVYTVQSLNASFKNMYGTSTSFSALQIQSSIKVIGTLLGTEITAHEIIVMPPYTHGAQLKGVVTSTSSASSTLFTVQTKNHGVISSVQVVTDANTLFVKNGSTTTAASLVSGSKVKIKGLWNEITNTLLAIKVKIF